MACLHLVPIWGVAYFPSQDGPAHVYGASALRGYFDADRPKLREFFTINPRPIPNWFTHGTLAILMLVTGPGDAEKLLLTGYVILLPLSFRYAMRTLDPASGFLAVLCFPLVYSFPLHMGFYNFVWSVVFLLLTLGYWFSHRERLSTRETFTLLFLFLLLYSAHLVSFIVTLVAIGAWTIWSLTLDVRRLAARGELSRTSLATATWARCVPVALASLPAFGLGARWILGRIAGPFESLPPAELLLHLVRLDLLAVWSPAERWLSTALAGLYTAMVGYALASHRRPIDHREGVWIVLAATLALYLLAPDSIAGGGLLSLRLSQYPVVIGILALASGTYSVRARHAIVLAGVIAALVGLAVRGVPHFSWARAVETDVSPVSGLARDSTLLTLRYPDDRHAAQWPAPWGRVNVLQHVSGYVAATHGLVDLLSYEGTTGYFPLQFRPHLDPFVHIGIDRGLDSRPPRVDFLSYPGRTGARIDYVLVWGRQWWTLDDPWTRSVVQQLDAGYELVPAAAPSTSLRVYQARERSGGPPR